MTRRESLVAMLGAVMGVSQKGIPGTRAATIVGPYVSSNCYSTYFVGEDGVVVFGSRSWFVAGREVSKEEWERHRGWEMEVTHDRLRTP